MQISQRMWDLWPLLVNSYHTWAEDYLEHILVPLENYICRGTAVFLAGQNPSYLQQVHCCAPHAPCTRPAHGNSADNTMHCIVR